MDDYTPIYQGDVSTPLEMHFTDHSGEVWKLIGQNGFTLDFVHQSNPEYSFQGANSGTIVSVADGIGQYVLAPSDVADPGEYLIQVTLTPSGKVFDPRPLEILARISLERK